MSDRLPGELERAAVVAGLRRLGPRSLRLSPGRERSIRAAIGVRAARLRWERRRARLVWAGWFVAGVLVGAGLVYLIT